MPCLNETSVFPLQSFQILLTPTNGIIETGVKSIISGVAKNLCSICEKIVSGEFSDCSLSMKCFKYDALLLTNKEKWRGYVLNETRKDYQKMIDVGATSVWETIDGASAFDNAGSLCHGWSAIPVYYFNVLK